MSRAPVVYLLRTSDGRRARTYVGATVSLEHRLRQHNGERAGGARQTAGRTWVLVLHVSGPSTWRDALRFERAWRRIGARVVRAWDVPGRLRALELLLAKERWSSTSPLARDVPLAVHLAADADAWSLWAPAHVPVRRNVARHATQPPPEPCGASLLRNAPVDARNKMQDNSDDVDATLILPAGSRRVRKAPERYIDPDFAKIMIAEQERAELEEIDSDDDEEVAQELESDEAESDDDNASYDSDFVTKDDEEDGDEVCAGVEDPDYKSDEEEEEEEEEGEDEDESDEEFEEASDDESDAEEEVVKPSPAKAAAPAKATKGAKRMRASSPIDATGETPA